MAGPRATLSWELIGLDEEMKRLREMGAELEQEVYKVLGEHGKKIREGAKSRVPVSSGRLQRSLKMTRSRRKMYAKIYSKETADCYHAPFIEYGTKHSEARPFLGPAAREDEPDFVADIERIVEEMIRK
jgi:HK97 gp10 family phage protein